MNRIRGDQYKGNLEVGQRVHCILYGGKDGIISEIRGEQTPGTIRSLGGGCVVMGGSAHYQIVFEDHLSNVPECIIRGVQWYIFDVIEPKEVIHAAIERTTAVLESKRKSDKEKADAQAVLRASLPAKYPHLIAMNGSKTSSHALGAKNLRAELKRAFPAVKFSVRSESYSGGDSIHVGWTDGPLLEDVDKISGKYQEGSFDGMTDCYNYDHENVWPDVFGGAKYVSESRHESAALILKVATKMGFNLPAGVSDNYGNLPGLDWEGSQRIYSQARQTRA